MPKNSPRSKNEFVSAKEPLQMLLEYQKKVTNILESFTDGFFEVDANWKVIYWNGEAERLLGMPRTNVLGKNLWEVYDDAVPLKFFTEYHRAVANNIAVRFEEYFPTKKLWFEVAAFPTGEGLSVYFKDVSPQKKILEQLEEERKKYRDLFNLSPVPQWVYDLDTLDFLDVNDAAIKHYGYSRRDFMKMRIADIRPSEELPNLVGMLSSEIHFGIAHRADSRHQKKDGTIIHVHVEGNSIEFEGKNARMVTIIDRTLEVRAEIALEESIARFNIVSKATSDAIWDWDMATGNIIWNQGSSETFGYRKATYNEEWRRTRIHIDDQQEVAKRLDTALRKKKNRLKMEYRFLCPDGTYRSVLDRAFILFDADGRAFRIIGSIQDITERIVQLRKIKAQNVRLKEISWIQSHKVRAPLSNILGLAMLTQDGEMATDEIREVMRHIMTAAEELDQLLRQTITKA